MNKPTVVVLAAGMGSRYGGLKQLDSVGPNGETIIDYSVYDAIRAGFGKIVFIIRRDIEQAFREAIGSRYESKIKVEYAFQELDRLPEGHAVPAGRAKPWGTGHAILMAEEFVGEPFVVINGDDFYGADAFKVAADYLSRAQDGDQADYCMVGFTLRRTLSDFGTVSRGVCRLDGANLAGVTEITAISRDGEAASYPLEDGEAARLSGDEAVSMNMWGFTPSIFKHLGVMFGAFLDEQGQELKSEFYIPSVVNALIKARLARVRVLPTASAWFGVTYQEDKPYVETSIRELIAAGDYPAELWG